MPPALSPVLRPDGSFLTTPTATPMPMSHPARAPLDADQQRFVDRVVSRWSTVRETVRDRWVTGKPAPFRSKAVDFSDVDARHRRWVRQGRPAYGEAADGFHRRAQRFLLDNDPERRTSKLERDRNRTSALLEELREARQARLRRRLSLSTASRHGSLATWLAACFPCLDRRGARRQAEAAIRRRYTHAEPNRT